jgi:hypothetical protein
MAVNASGRISRIYAQKTYVAIRLANLPPELTPLSGYFVLRTTHPNYNALYSLALSAAVNRFVLTIRTEADISPQQTADVWYFVADWP